LYRIGHHVIDKQTILAPMAGVTDLPFRQLCRRYGAGLTVSEMVTADTRLWHSSKSRSRLPHLGEPGPRMIQIAGGDPAMLAGAARQNVELGAQIIDINMGCPAKKVCRKAAGSALLRDENLVTEILRAVVAAVNVPVTLKIRTGWDPEHRNGVAIARIAEDCGIAALAVHGRTRACRFEGRAEHDTVAGIVDAVSIPVFANGDITDHVQARQVLEYTGAAAVMIGRAAQGAPWIFREINQYLETGEPPAPVDRAEKAETLLSHLGALHRFYGERRGVRIARKHVGWYLDTLPGGADLRRAFNRLDEPGCQYRMLRDYFHHTTENREQAA
jgi:tRNA-dihydrouridine synthase B